jgi:hypothetical protein
VLLVVPRLAVVAVAFLAPEAAFLADAAAVAFFVGALAVAFAGAFFAPDLAALAVAFFAAMWVVPSFSRAASPERVRHCRHAAHTKQPARRVLSTGGGRRGDAVA